jgi:hypothetical protein
LNVYAGVGGRCVAAEALLKGFEIHRVKITNRFL